MLERHGEFGTIGSVFRELGNFQRPKTEDVGEENGPLFFLRPLSQEKEVVVDDTLCSLIDDDGNAEPEDTAIALPENTRPKEFVLKKQQARQGSYFKRTEIMPSPFFPTSPFISMFNELRDLQRSKAGDGEGKKGALSVVKLTVVCNAALLWLMLPGCHREGSVDSKSAAGLPQEEFPNISVRSDFLADKDTETAAPTSAQPDLAEDSGHSIDAGTDDSDTESDTNGDTDTLFDTADDATPITVYDHSAKLYPSPGNPEHFLPTARLKCGPVRILETVEVDGQVWYHVRQDRKYGDISGWTDDDVGYNWGDNNCYNRVVPQHPGAPRWSGDGLVLVDKKSSLEAARRLRKKYRVWLPTTDGCESWRLERGALRRNEVMLKDTPTGPPVRVVQTQTWGFRMKGTEVYVTGPLFSRRVNGRQMGIGGYGCSAVWEVVGGNDHEVHLVRRGGFRLVGFNPVDMTIFYMDKKSCQTAWNKNPRLKIDDPAFKETAGIRIFHGTRH